MLFYRLKFKSGKEYIRIISDPKRECEVVSKQGQLNKVSIAILTCRSMLARLHLKYNGVYFQITLCEIVCSLKKELVYTRSSVSRGLGGKTILKCLANYFDSNSAIICGCRKLQHTKQ